MLEIGTSGSVGAPGAAWGNPTGARLAQHVGRAAPCCRSNTFAVSRRGSLTICDTSLVERGIALRSGIVATGSEV